MSENEQTTEIEIDWSIVKNYVSSYYHLALLAVLFVFMLYTRVRSYKNFIMNDGTIAFSGNDAWYHYRQITYTVHNWPDTMVFDVWTGYPTGVTVGHFGTLYDQIVATVALLVGMGSPSVHTIKMVQLFSPAVFGALAVIPVYYIGRQLHNRVTGLLSSLVLVLLPGAFFSRTLAGYADHHAAEVFFMSAAVAVTIYAIRVAEQEFVVTEMLVNAVEQRDFSEVRRFVIASVAAGVAMSLYMWAWPPGILLVGVFALYIVFHSIIDGMLADTPEPVLLLGVLSMVTAAVMMVIPFSGFKYTPVFFGVLHIAFPLATAAGAGFVIWLSRYVSDEGLPQYTIPGVVIGGLALMAVIIKMVTPHVFQVLYKNTMGILGLTTSAQTKTISEAQPFVEQLSSFAPAVISEYGMMFFAAIASLAIILLIIWSAYRQNKYRQTGAKLFFAVWVMIMVFAAFTQVRFNYYLALAVATGAGYMMSFSLGLVNIHDDFPSLQVYQYIAILLIALLFVPTLIYPVSGNVVSQSDTNAGPGSYTAWEDSLTWMSDNTPEEGNLHGVDNTLNYYEEYPREDDYKYPEGTYGVMSWWDYGHWITVTGERIPNANPFQQHAQKAAEYLLANSSSEAEEVVTNMSNSESERAPKYIAVDWQMVNPMSKLSAPAVFHDNLTPRDLFEVVYVTGEDNQQIRGRFIVKKQRYYESMMVRLYKFHGSAVSSQGFFVNYRPRTFRTQTGESVTVNAAENGSILKQFRSPDKLDAYARNNSGQVGGLGNFPQEDIEALEHYRLVKTSSRSATSAPSYRQYLQSQSQALGVPPQAFFQNPSWVKIFERVEGAEVHGTGPANATVTARVTMNMSSSGSTFVYQQHAETDSNGEFEMVLPYSTTGYDEVPDEGYTNVDVRANGNYTFSSFSFKNGTFAQYKTTADVSETKVVGIDDEPVVVELEEQEPQQPDTTGNSTDETGG